MITLEALNALPASEFVATLGAIFEHSPWVAEGAAARRPFQSRLQLLEAMREVVQRSSEAQQLALIRAHPRLGAGRRARVVLTESSAREQKRAGLDACTAQQLAHLEQLNDAYAQRFGFPFVLAVRGHDPLSIIARFEQRLAHERVLEQRTALAEIGVIAGYRLADLVSSPPWFEALAMLERVGPDTALLREWMLAAGFEIAYADVGSVLGLARASDDDAQPGAAKTGVPRTLLLGVNYDPQAGAMRYDPPSGVMIAVATRHWLRQQGIAPASAVAILARPVQPGETVLAKLVEPALPRACMPMDDIITVGEAAQAGEAHTKALQALRAAALDTQRCVILCGSYAPDGAQRARMDAAVAEHAARALQTYLIKGSDQVLRPRRPLK